VRLYNEELKQQYFEDKFVQFREQCEDHGDAQACFSLGEWYQLIGKNMRKAFQVYDENCYRKNHGNSCFNLAALYMSSPEIREDTTIQSLDEKINAQPDHTQRAKLLTQQACENGKSFQACSAYVKLLFQDRDETKGVEDENVKRGLAIYENMCFEEKDPNSCSRLGLLYINGEKFNIPRQPEKALRAAKRGCLDGYDPKSCHILSVMHKQGDGVPKDSKKAEAYKKMTMDILNQRAQAMGAQMVGQ